MQKKILITGSTDGIGLETAKMMTEAGHKVLLHGRSYVKLEAARETLVALSGGVKVDGYIADLSRFNDIAELANSIARDYETLDVLINNAGVFKTPNPIAENGLDVRFMVNTIAPHILTALLLPLLGRSGRIVSLSSAAQSPVNLKALTGRSRLNDIDAYSQSKLALTMWSAEMARSHEDGPVFIAVNPGSLLASKMVKEGFGIAGNDIGIGASILSRLSIEEDYAPDSGKYFDNDRGRFGAPHSDALDLETSKAVVDTIKTVAANLTD
ncbi:MAG: SDR family NAD(P)-dependent oxidoreductase [Hellea sp.]